MIPIYGCMHHEKLNKLQGSSIMIPDTHVRIAKIIAYNANLSLTFAQDDKQLRDIGSSVL